MRLFFREVVKKKTKSIVLEAAGRGPRVIPRNKHGLPTAVAGISSRSISSITSFSFFQKKWLCGDRSRVFGAIRVCTDAKPVFDNLRPVGSGVIFDPYIDRTGRIKGYGP